MSLVLWTLALTLLLLAIRVLATPFTPSRVVKALFLPGVLVAIAARSMACALAGASLRHVNFPWREGEPVEHEPPRVPVLGGLALALIPFAGATAAILAARAALGYPLEFHVELPMIEATPEGLAVFVRTSGEILHALYAATPAAALGQWRAPAFLYLALSTLLFAAPQWDEWKSLAGGIGALWLLLWGGEYLGLQAGFLSRGWFIRVFYSEPVFDSLVLLLATALLALALLAAWRAGTAFARATFLPKKKRRTK